MIKHIGNITKMKHVKLVKTGCILLSFATIITFTGCDNKKLENYYLVSKDGSYSICSKTDAFINVDDIQFNSIIDNKTIGCICTKGDSFDYEKHHFVVQFISEMQVAGLNDVLNKDDMSFQKILELANSKELQKIGDKYFEDKHYGLKENFKYFAPSSLKLFKIKDEIIIGYNLTPNRIKDENRFIYSIIDKDTIQVTSADQVVSLDINIDDQKYLSYSDASDIVSKYNREDKKVMILNK